jgi:ABC-2 type transport system permease protein
MFRHIYLGRLRLLLRSKADVFWTLIYPIILAVFFTMAFSNLASADDFNPIPVAVVENEELNGQTAFLQTLHSVSDESSANEEKLFHVTYTTKEAAEQSLSDGAVKGYILFDNGAHVVVKDSGFEQTFIKQFMDSVLQIGSSYRTIISADPAAASSIRYGGEQSYLSDGGTTSRTQANSIIISFYGLIAMAAMFGGFWGRKEVEDIQANMSPHAMRMNLAPVHKLKAFGSSVCAAITIHFLSLVIIVVFMALVLHVDFGAQLGAVLATCLVSSIMGVAFGAMVAALVKNSGIRIAVMLAVSLALSSLAGMVSPSLKYLVTDTLPVLSYLNPANLISDAFYALYYGYNARFILNLALMLGFAVVFTLVVYLVTRRQKYASL